MFKLFSRKTDKEPKEMPKTVQEVVKEVNEKYNKPNKRLISITGTKLKTQIDKQIKEFCDYDKFIEDSKEYSKNELRESISSNIDHNFIYFHIYGDIPSYDKNISKVDFIKDCRTFQVVITDVVDLRNSVRFLRNYIRRFDNFLYNLAELYNDYLDSTEIYYSKEENNILKRVGIIVESYLTDTSYCMNVISNLLCNLNEYYDNNPNEIKEKISVVKHDTLKRYYFTNTYYLKNSVKIFNKETMCFGEINNIMKQYNYIYNFVFGTLVCNIQTIKTLFESIK